MRASYSQTKDRRPIASAPRDGREIEVFLTGEGLWVVARWAKQAQAWILSTDPMRRTLHGVTHWR